MTRPPLPKLVVLLAALSFLIPLAAACAVQETPQGQGLEKRVDRIEAQLAIIRDYNDDFLSTVHWSLGVVSTMTLILLGFSWFSNFRILDREKEALRGELTTFLSLRLKELEASLDKKNLDELTLLRQKVGETTKAAIASSLAPVEARLDGLRDQVLDLRFSEAKGEYQEWCRQKVLTNQCRAARRMLELAEEMRYGYYINEALDKLIESLKALALAGGRLEALDVSELSTALSVVPSSHSTMVAAVHQHLSRITGV
jgi:hypothetical protein